jgi:starvation-inducible outer membrane lipoprotein
MRDTLIKWLVLILVLLAAGCSSSHVLSPTAHSTVDLPGGYKEFLRDPGAATGRTLMLAGFIVSNKVSREGTVLTLRPYTMDKRGVPRSPVKGSGELLARSERILDPARFGPGHLISFTATYVGREPRAVAEKQFGRPLFEIGEIHWWPKEPHYPYGYRYPFRIY